MSTKTWFITGASKGFGLEFIAQLLAKGDNVAATSRSIAELTKAAGTHPNLLALEVSLTDEQSVTDAVAKTIEKFGRLDIVVNNAGYGLMGALEELNDAESRANFDVNVFGSLNVIRQTMPHLRKQGSGHIINISSIGGFTGNFPGFGIYCATKFAVAGFTESLAVEAKPFGIHATVVLPGYFRTSFLESGSIAGPKNPLDAYQSVRDIITTHEEQINGNQPGDPVKGVAEIIALTETAQPPVYFFLGKDSIGLARDKMARVTEDLTAWEAAGSRTDF